MKREGGQLKIGVVLSYVNLIVGNLIPVFYTPIMLALLGQSEYGLFKLSSSVTSYLGLMSLGIGSAVTRYLIKARAEEGREGESVILGLFVRIFKLIAVVTMAVGLVLVWKLDVFYDQALTDVELHRMRVLVFIMACNTVVSFWTTPYISVVTAHEQFLFQQCMNIITTCVGPALNLVALWLGYASVGMAISSLAVNVVVQWIYWLFVRNKLQIHCIHRKVEKNLLYDILRFSFWVFVANVMNQLYNATDVVMIGMVPALATTGAAIYSIGSMINHIVLALTTGVTNVLSPRINKMVFSGADNTQLLGVATKVGRIQGYIIGLLASGFVAFGRPFIHLYAGEGYDEAYWVAVFMMVPHVIPLVQTVCLSVIVAKNKHRFRSLVYLGIAIMNVIGTWFMMQHMGIVGAALMTGAALVLGQGFVMNWYYHKKIGLNMVVFWKTVAKVFAVPLLMCLVTLAIATRVDFYSWGNLLLGIGVYTVIFCALSWLAVMNRYEKSIITGMLSVLTRKKSA